MTRPLARILLAALPWLPAVAPAAEEETLRLRLEGAADDDDLDIRLTRESGRWVAADATVPAWEQGTMQEWRGFHLSRGAACAWRSTLLFPVAAAGLRLEGERLHGQLFLLPRLDVTAAERVPDGESVGWWDRFVPSAHTRARPMEIEIDAALEPEATRFDLVLYGDLPRDPGATEEGKGSGRRDRDRDRDRRLLMTVRLRVPSSRFTPAEVATPTWNGGHHEADATDGTRVFLHGASGAAAAFRLDGERLWVRETALEGPVLHAYGEPDTRGGLLALEGEATPGWSTGGDGEQGSGDDRKSRRDRGRKGRRVGILLLDAATGEERGRWTRPGRFHAPFSRLLVLRSGSGETPLLITSTGWRLDLARGRLLEPMDIEPLEHGGRAGLASGYGGGIGHAVVVCGDLIVHSTQDQCLAIRLWRTESGETGYDHAWETSWLHAGFGSFVAPGRRVVDAPLHAGARARPGPALPRPAPRAPRDGPPHRASGRPEEAAPRERGPPRRPAGPRR